MEPTTIAFLALGCSLVVGFGLIALFCKYDVLNNTPSRDSAPSVEFDGEVLSLSRLPPSPVSPRSPLVLTDLGLKISGIVAASEWAKSLAASHPHLFETIDLKEPYDIQESAFQYAKEFNPSLVLLKKMSNCAYLCGTDLDTVRRVMGMELRDVFLAYIKRLPSIPE